MGCFLERKVPGYIYDMIKFFNTSAMIQIIACKVTGQQYGRQLLGVARKSPFNSQM
jgi:hypothetical protein